METLQTLALIRTELQQDLGLAGDITTQAVVATQQMATGKIIARQAGCVCGLTAAMQAFTLLDNNTKVERFYQEGDSVSADTVLASVTGKASVLLAAERTALNFLAHLSGIATQTQRVVQQVADNNVQIACTRKTTPGLRGLEKYAVKTGGGMNHRFGLYDAILIKDNHIQLAGSISVAIQLARQAHSHMVKMEVEVDTLSQLQTALDQHVDLILLDNMPAEMLREAVSITAGRATLEASGGITLENIQSIASTGIQIISLGSLTHSAPALDVALDISKIAQII